MGRATQDAASKTNRRSVRRKTAMVSEAAPIVRAYEILKFAKRFAADHDGSDARRIAHVDAIECSRMMIVRRLSNLV